MGGQNASGVGRGLAVALDISKAFDSIPHAEISSALQAASVPLEIRHLVLCWITGAQYHVQGDNGTIAVDVCRAVNRDACCLLCSMFWWWPGFAANSGRLLEPRRIIYWTIMRMTFFSMQNLIQCRACALPLGELSNYLNASRRLDFRSMMKKRKSCSNSVAPSPSKS